MTAEQWLDKQQILKILPISQMTWERWIRAGKVPPYTRIGRTRFWKASDIFSWMEENKVKTA